MEIKVGTHKIVYLYNALGQKLRKAVIGETTDDNDYLDGFQYYKKSLKHFPTAEGYVSPVKTSAGYSFKYVYNYVDHLGNIRMNYSLDTDGSTLKILEENHYYPFGLKHTNYNRSIREWAREMPEEEVVLKAPPVDPGGTEQPFYKYKYNGQEWQDELALNMTAMDFRQYDNAIGRFVGVDALAEKNNWQSPYHFGNNNPNYWGDPTGLDSVTFEFDWSIIPNGTTTIRTLFSESDIDSATGDLWLKGPEGGFALVENSLEAVTVGYNTINEHFVGNLSGILQSHVYSNSRFYAGWRREQRSAQWDSFQSGLDWFGAVPILGEALDLVNAGISLGRGRYGAAALSAAAMVPVAGSAIPALKQSHHIIPKAVYKEFKSDLSGVMKLNGAKNLMELPVPFHGNHPQYSRYVTREINALKRANNLTPGSIEALQGNLRGMIDDALLSGQKLNDYFRP